MKGSDALTPFVVWVAALGLLVGGCSWGHAIGAYFQPVSTMTTDRFAALKLERSLAMEYARTKVLVDQACKAQVVPKPLCTNLSTLAHDFEAADALVLAQLYDLSTSAFDLTKVMDLAKALGGAATLLAPLVGL